MTALANLVTCWIEAGPAAPLIQANECRTFSFGIHGAVALDLHADVALLEQ